MKPVKPMDVTYVSTKQVKAQIHEIDANVSDTFSGEPVAVVRPERRSIHGVWFEEDRFRRPFGEDCKTAGACHAACFEIVAESVSSFLSDVIEIRLAPQLLWVRL